MSNIEDIKKKFDNYEITSDEIKNEDKIKIAKMYKDEIDILRKDIKEIKSRILDYERKINNLKEKNKSS